MQVNMATEPASPDRANEDFVAASPTAVVLLDGAGAPPGIDFGCAHSVAWFVRQLGSRFLAEADAPAPLADCLAAAISQTAALHVDTCDLGGQGGPAATVVAARLRGGQLDYLVLADSTLMLAYPEELRIITDDREAKAGQPYRAAVDSTSNGSPEHDTALADYIRTMQTQRNTANGFWVAAADPNAAHQAITDTLPLHDLAAIALLSDGATRLVDRFDLISWRQALSIVQAPDGPTKLIRQTRQAENSDPHGQRWPRGKANDDATIAIATLACCDS
jgi:Protein phosphatase 2C